MPTNTKMAISKILSKNKDVSVSSSMPINNHMPVITPQTGMYQPKSNMMHIKITNEDDQVSTNHRLGTDLKQLWTLRWRLS
jgi:hypothetical protein